MLQIPLAKLSGDSSDWPVPVDDSLILLESRKGEALNRDPPSSGAAAIPTVNRPLAARAGRRQYETLIPQALWMGTLRKSLPVGAALRGLFTVVAIPPQPPCQTVQWRRRFPWLCPPCGEANA